ncbi:MAG: zeta toxin family protein [Bacteroidetes bacterium]|nr:zeta toxin family protein [Bacteroidota bacterium]
MPNLYIIAGCNGAGKTTASLTFLPEMLNCYEFVNADSIAAGLSPLRPESVSFEAGRIMLNRINKLIDDRVDFAFETTLSTRSYPSLIKSAKNKGYDIGLLFFWLPSSDMAKERVKLRVENGGHSIPEDVIVRRYYREISNLINIYYSLADNWFVFDNTMPKSQLIAGRQNAIVNQVINSEIWDVINKTANEY